jgi:hypothetical protein
MASLHVAEDLRLCLIDEESRAQKPSLLLRPALLVWFEVRVTRVSVQKSACINKVNPLEPRLV